MLPKSPRILAVTAGAASKRNAMTAALADLYAAEILPGKRFSERPKDLLLAPLGLGAVRRNLDALNRAILDREGTFDILFVVKGNFVTAETLNALKARPNPPVIVGWSCDDIYLPHNNSSVLKAAAPHYDIFYTAKSLNITGGELAQMGFPRAEFLHQGFDRDVHRPFKVPRSRFEGKIVFVGYGERDRFEKMNHLARNGIEVDIWGNGWKRNLIRDAHSNLCIHGTAILGDHYAEALSNAAINLCFLRKLNRDLHTSRSFEIPACGGFMLAERTDEHRAYFEEDREAVYFGDADELLEKVRRYLADPAARAAIAEAGYRRTRDCDYSYHRLARLIVEQVRGDFMAAS